MSAISGTSASELWRRGSGPHKKQGAAARPTLGDEQESNRSSRSYLPQPTATARMYPVASISPSPSLSPAAAAETAPTVVVAATKPPPLDMQRLMMQQQCSPFGHYEPPPSAADGHGKSNGSIGVEISSSSGGGHSIGGCSALHPVHHHHPIEIQLSNGEDDELPTIRNLVLHLGAARSSETEEIQSLECIVCYPTTGDSSDKILLPSSIRIIPNYDILVKIFIKGFPMEEFTITKLQLSAIANYQTPWPFTEEGSGVLASRIFFFDGSPSQWDVGETVCNCWGMAVEIRRHVLPSDDGSESLQQQQPQHQQYQQNHRRYAYIHPHLTQRASSSEQQFYSQAPEARVSNSLQSSNYDSVGPSHDGDDEDDNDEVEDRGEEDVSDPLQAEDDTVMHIPSCQHTLLPQMDTCRTTCPQCQRKEKPFGASLVTLFLWLTRLLRLIVTCCSVTIELIFNIPYMPLYCVSLGLSCLHWLQMWPGLFVAAAQNFADHGDDTRALLILATHCSQMPVKLFNWMLMNGRKIHLAADDYRKAITDDQQRNRTPTPSTTTSRNSQQQTSLNNRINVLPPYLYENTPAAAITATDKLNHHPKSNGCSTASGISFLTPCENRQPAQQQMYRKT